MIELKLFGFVLLLTPLLWLGSSCTEEADEIDPGPTQEEMQKVATEACEHSIMCGVLPDDVTLEDCVTNEVGSYQDAPECLAIYYYDECQITLTCEELQLLGQFDIGPCVDERKEAVKVTCAP